MEKKKLKELIEYIESREKVHKELNYPFNMIYHDIVAVKNRIKKDLSEEKKRII